MLKTTRHCGNTLLLVPSGACSSSMSVADLFSDGPIGLKVIPRADGSLEVEVTAPHCLTLLDQPSQGVSSHNPSVQPDLFQSGEDNFDDFLEQEAARLALESEAVSRLKTSRKQGTG